jgi:hypothetical protein
MRDLNHEFDRADGTLTLSKNTTWDIIELDRRPVHDVERRLTGADSGIKASDKSIEITRAGPRSEAWKSQRAAARNFTVRAAVIRPGSQFSLSISEKKKVDRRASADLWTTIRPDAHLAQRLTKKSEEEVVRGNQTGGAGVTVSQASA